MLAGSWRWLREQFAFVVVVAVIAAGFVLLLADPGRWRLGTALIALAVLIGGLIRLVLPTARAGFLAVRARGIDVLLYGIAGAVILVVDLRLRS